MGYVSRGQDQFSAMRQYLGSLIAERTGITDKQELADKTDDAKIWVASAASFVSVKRISYAVGHIDLTNTYGRLLAANGDVATAVIDATIKLDHFERGPEKELREMEGKVTKSFFATRVIRDLVADCIYDVDFPTMQMLGSLWGTKFLHLSTLRIVRKSSLIEAP
jgi:hypothetical protein